MFFVVLREDTPVSSKNVCLRLCGLFECMYDNLENQQQPHRGASMLRVGSINGYY